MTAEQQELAVTRHRQAAEIITDLERQHGFELPDAWHVCLGTLLLGGIGDPELHQIFDAYARVEHEAGRMEAKPFDPAGFLKD